MDKEIEALSSVSLFSNMQEDDLQHIMSLSQRKTYDKGEVIIKEGDRDRVLYIVLSGLIDVIKDKGGDKEKTLRVMGPNNYFGEMALIDEKVRSASVVARENTEVLSIDHLDMKKELIKYPEMAMELLQTMSKRVRELENAMVNTIGRFLPICANCKSIRENDDTWKSIEIYIGENAETEFTHSLCPECINKLYPEYADKI